MIHFILLSYYKEKEMFRKHEPDGETSTHNVLVESKAKSDAPDNDLPSNLRKTGIVLVH